MADLGEVTKEAGDANDNASQGVSMSGDKSSLSSPDEKRSNDYYKLIDAGLDKRVCDRLEEIYETGTLTHQDLDDRAIDALKEFPPDGALSVLDQFVESNLEHVSNKSAYLCGVMKTYRQRTRSGHLNGGSISGHSNGANEDGSIGGGNAKGPDKEKIKKILERTGYRLDVTTGQRKYGGPPPGWEGDPPGNGCEVFCGKIPRDLYEDELIPLFEQCGTIWDLRLMMDPMTGLNRGYAFVTYTDREAAQNAVRELNSYDTGDGNCLIVNVSEPKTRLFVGNIPKSKGKEELHLEFNNPPDKVPTIRLGPTRYTIKELILNCIVSYESLQLNDFELRKGKRIGVTISFNNHRLFVGNIPKNRDREELFEEFSKHAPGLKEVIIYSSPDDKKKNRGFCFLEYESHKAASLAKRRLETGRVKVWNCDIIVDWADPQEEPDEQTMSQVKVLYVRNLTAAVTEEKLRETFETHGKVDRVKKIKDYAFVHFEDREQAVAALNALNKSELCGVQIDVSLAKPPSDKKKKEEMLRKREQRLMKSITSGNSTFTMVPFPPFPPAFAAPFPPAPGLGMLRGSLPTVGRGGSMAGGHNRGNMHRNDYGAGFFNAWGAWPDGSWNPRIGGPGPANAAAGGTPWVSGDSWSPNNASGSHNRNSYGNWNHVNSTSGISGGSNSSNSRNPHHHSGGGRGRVKANH